MGAKNLSWLRSALVRVVLAAVAIAVALAAARSISGVTGQFGWHVPLVALVVILSPPAFFLALRYPMIFPFSLFVALIPFDVILQFTQGATIVRLVAIGTGLAMVARILLTRSFLVPRRAWLVWLAYIAWAGFSFMWTVAPGEGQRVYGILVQNFLLMTMLAIYPLEKIEFRWLIGANIVSGLFAGAYEIYSRGHSFDHGRVTIVSSTGLTVDPNWFATSFLIPLALALAIALGTRSLLLRLSCWAAALTMMIGLLLTGSRGGFVAVVFLFAYFAWRSRKRIQVLAVATACLSLTAFYPVVWQRFLKDPGGGTGSGRLDIWRVGLYALKDVWLFGTGIGSFLETYERNFLEIYQHYNQGWHRPAHNMILGMGVEVGVIGLALLLVAWYLSFRQMRVIPKTSEYYPFRVAFEAAIIGLFIQAMFIDPMWIKYVWLGLSMPFVLLNAYAPQPVGQTSRAFRRPRPIRVAAPPRRVVPVRN